jgi:BirA family biotin operon repressor/biotin-[acetyl-CoA-carboxylase] ligase
MDVAAAAAAAGAAEGFTVVADEQTAGRGRRGHGWSSPAGAGLYLSMLLRPPHDERGARVLPLMTIAAGVAVRRAIGRATGLWADLKWPNDLLVGGRKLSGILAEGHQLASPQQAVVIGAGINVSHAVLPAALASCATSLEAELGRRVTRGQVLEPLLVALPETYDELRRGDADAILREWRGAAPDAAGAPVEWDHAGEVRCGTTAGVDGDGALLIRTGAALERFIGGELRWK